MQSYIRRNVLSRYKVCIPDILKHSSAKICGNHYEKNLDPQLLCQTQLVRQLVITRDGLYYLTDMNFLLFGITQAIVFYVLSDTLIFSLLF